MKFDIDGMQRNVLPLINTANKGIENIESKINAITIPSKFKSKDKIQYLKSKVGSIKGKILGSVNGNGIAGKIEAKIAKVQNAESSNKALLDGIGLGTLKNLGKAKKYIYDTSDLVNQNVGNSYAVNKIGGKNDTKAQKRKVSLIRGVSDKVNDNLGTSYNVNNGKNGSKIKINGNINSFMYKKLGDGYRLYEKNPNSIKEPKERVDTGVTISIKKIRKSIEIGNKIVKIPNTEIEAPWKDSNLNPYIGIGSERSMYMVCMGKVL